MRRCLFTTITLAHLACLACIAQAEPLIPDRCFVNGDLDCERPECHDICFTPPTPGYERLPFKPPPSGLRNPDGEEAERILAGPRLQVPFKEDIAPANAAQIADPKLVPPKNAVSCDPQNSEEMYDILRGKAFAKKWIEVTNDRIKHHIFDEIDNYQQLHDNENLYDLFTFKQLEAACYRVEDQCIKNGDKDIKLKRHEAFSTYASIRNHRDRYYNSLLDCLKHPKCTQPSYTYSVECLSSECRSDFQMNLIKEDLKRYQDKFAKQVEELKAMQCSK